MMKGYQKGGMADDMGRAMPKMPPMPMSMKKGGKAMKKGK